MGEQLRPPENNEWSNEWETLKQRAPFFAIDRGRQLGVPEDEIVRYAQEIVAERTASGDHVVAYRLKKMLNLGDESEIRKTGELAYKTFFDSRELVSAMQIAKEVYGQDSEEFRRAEQENRKRLDEMEKNRTIKEVKEKEVVAVSISPDATFKDLFGVIADAEEEPGDLGFESELFDNFDQEIADKIIEMQDDPKEASQKVLEFFKKEGYSKSDVSTLLPIKFKRKKGK